MYDMYPGWDPDAAPEPMALDGQVARRKRLASSQPHVARVRAVQESLDRRDNGGRPHGEDAFVGRAEGTWPWRGISG